MFFILFYNIRFDCGTLQKCVIIRTKLFLFFYFWMFGCFSKSMSLLKVLLLNFKCDEHRYDDYVCFYINFVAGLCEISS